MRWGDRPQEEETVERQPDEELLEAWTIEVKDLLRSADELFVVLAVAAAIGLVSFGAVYWLWRSRQTA